MFLNGFVTIALLAAVAMVSGTPFVFPSLGPTAFLFFFTPRAPAASPRHTIYGARHRHRVRIRRAVAVRPAARAAGDGDRRVARARRRRGAIAGVDGCGDDSRQERRTRPPGRRPSSSRSGL